MTSVAQHEREAGDVLSTARTLDQVEPPTRLGRYELAYILGMGTSAVVFAAHDTKLEREVAIKVFRSHCTTEAIRREAIALARIDHPNVLDLHEIGEADGLEFLAEKVGTVAPARARLRVGVPVQLLRVIRRGLAVDARGRHESMSALADALTRVSSDAGRHEDRRWAIAAAVATAGILLALAWLVTRFL